MISTRTGKQGEAGLARMSFSWVAEVKGWSTPVAADWSVV